MNQLLLELEKFTLYKKHNQENEAFSKQIYASNLIN
jgi:hypothetical protein